MTEKNISSIAFLIVFTESHLLILNVDQISVVAVEPYDVWQTD